MSIFSERLKWLRERKGFTQQLMSEKIELSRSNYGKYEYGQREPNLDTLRKLPSILGESLDFMLGVTDFTTNAQILLSKFEEASLAYSIVESDKEKDLWKNRKEIAREKVIAMLKEVPHVNDNAYKKLDESDEWVALLDEVKQKDPQ